MAANSTKPITFSVTRVKSIRNTILQLPVINETESTTSVSIWEIIIVSVETVTINYKILL